MSEPARLPAPSREFLEELSRRARAFGWRCDYTELENFVRGLYEEAGVEPGDLTPTEDDD